MLDLIELNSHFHSLVLKIRIYMDTVGDIRAGKSGFNHNSHLNKVIFKTIFQPFPKYHQ